LHSVSDLDWCGDGDDEVAECGSSQVHSGGLEANWIASGIAELQEGAEAGRLMGWLTKSSSFPRGFQSIRTVSASRIGMPP